LIHCAKKDPAKKAGHQPIITGLVPLANKNMAGPGHRFAKPQPIPKQKAPPISSTSMMQLHGMENLLTKRGFRSARGLVLSSENKRLKDLTNWYEIMLTMQPPIITVNSVGS
jgi:hypothetical protein